MFLSFVRKFHSGLWPEIRRSCWTVRWDMVGMQKCY